MPSQQPPLRQRSKSFIVRTHDAAVKVKSSYTKQGVAVHALGTLVAASAGIVNMVGFYSLGGVFVSHVSGTAMAAVSGGEIGHTGVHAIFPFLLLLSFMTGSVICGFLIPTNTVTFGEALYDVALFLVSGLLVLTWAMEHKGTNLQLANCLVLMAMGLQNGIATSYSGAVVRTTHVTGTATDIGINVGRLLSRFVRRRCSLDEFDELDWAETEVEVRKFVLLSCLLLGFIFGGFLGIVLFHAIGDNAFLVPAGITGSLAASYFGYRVVHLGRDFFDVGSWDTYQSVQGLTARAMASITLSPRSQAAQAAKDYGSMADDSGSKDLEQPDMMTMGKQPSIRLPRFVQDPEDAEQAAPTSSSESEKDAPEMLKKDNRSRSAPETSSKSALLKTRRTMMAAHIRADLENL